MSNAKRRHRRRARRRHRWALVARIEQEWAALGYRFWSSDGAWRAWKLEDPSAPGRAFFVQTVEVP